MLKLKIRKEWTVQQAVDDIELQLQGRGFDDRKATRVPPPPPAQQRLLEALTIPPSANQEWNWRRDNAVKAAVAYCLIEEPTVQFTSKLKTVSQATDLLACSAPGYDQRNGALEYAIRSVFISSERERPRRCFVCVGMAVKAEESGGTTCQLIREFHSPSDLTKHLKRKHLRKLKNDEQVCVRSAGRNPSTSNISRTTLYAYTVL